MRADEPAELQRRIAAFVRAFGLHKPDETPCGAPVPVSEAHALAVLAESGPATQTELARRLGLSKSTVSRLVDELERHRWAHRRTATVDARQRLVELTSQGRTVAVDIDRRRGERMADLLAHIPERDRQIVLAALDTLVEAARAT